MGFNPAFKELIWNSDAFKISTHQLLVCQCLNNGMHSVTTPAWLNIALTFKTRASYIWDGRTATLQMLHFIYFFQQL